MSRRLALAASNVLGRKSSRRSFLTRAAMTGTAMSVAPLDFALRPGTAYAAVCSCVGSECDCDSLCCGGYTEFCCTLTGQNTCPPGTVPAGWWKADGSGYCGPNAPRYYLDCNIVECGDCGCGPSGVCSGGCSGTPCECGRGDCNNRKTACVHFRYGQCSQDTKCLGPILCRKVTCIPPWTTDDCTAAVATDNNTATHNRPCLNSLPFGGFDPLSSDGETISVSGWVVDPDSDRSVKVHVYIDDVVTASVTANSSRPDVAAEFPSVSANHGFSQDFPVPQGNHKVCVYAIGVGGTATNVLLGCRYVDSRDAVPTGSFDAVVAAATTVTVRGWTYDPNTPTQATKVHVYIDGVGVGIAVAAKPRPDVGRAFPGIGDNHGFSKTVSVSPGRHTVCLYAINTRPGGTNTLIGCRSFTATDATPSGSFDVAKGTDGAIIVSGWAVDPDTPFEPVDIHFYVDGVGAGVTRADKQRPDVGAAFPDIGPKHGFIRTLQATPGIHQVCAYGINTGVGAANALLSCKTVEVF